MRVELNQPSFPRWRVSDVLLVLGRWAVGLMFIYLGAGKALHPVEFLKLVRQYDVFEHYFLLNFVASTLPWFEVFCGLLLVLGIAVRGTAVMVLAMLIPFTALVFLRALALQEANPQPFCAIKFDCGCGAGEVLICRKLAENVLLVALSGLLVASGRNHLCIRHGVWS